MPKDKTLVPIDCDIASLVDGNDRFAVFDDTEEYVGGRWRRKWFWLWRGQATIGDDKVVWLPKWIADKHGLKTLEHA